MNAAVAMGFKALDPMPDTESGRVAGSHARSGGFKALDPMADTERARLAAFAVASWRFKALDPMADTERAGALGLGSAGRVSRHSIRWRILKGWPVQVVHAHPFGFKALDPMADTERRSSPRRCATSSVRRTGGVPVGVRGGGCQRIRDWVRIGARRQDRHDPAQNPSPG